MDDGEAAEVLRYFQSAMQRAGFEDVNARIVRQVRLDPGSPRAQLRRYIDALGTEIRLRTDDQVTSIVNRINEVARTSSGGVIDGISLEFVEGDRNLFGLDELSLGLPIEMTSVLEGLDRISAELDAERPEA
jgi:hypothetical protein